MRLDAAWLEDVLTPRMPRARERAQLSLVPWNGVSTAVDATGLWACFELARTGSPGSTKGPSLLFLPKHLEMPRERALAYLEAWVSVVDDVLDRADDNVLMHLRTALLVRPQVLDLKRTKTVDDYAKALRSEKQLGKLLGEVGPAMRRIDHGTS